MNVNLILWEKKMYGLHSVSSLFIFLSLHAILGVWLYQTFPETDTKLSLLL